MPGPHLYKIYPKMNSGFIFRSLNTSNKHAGEIEKGWLKISILVGT